MSLLKLHLMNYLSMNSKINLINQLDYGTIPNYQLDEVSSGGSLGDFGHLVGKSEKKLFKRLHKFAYAQLNNLLKEGVKAVNDYIELTIGGIITSILAGMGLSSVLISVLVGLATTYLVKLVKNFVHETIKDVINYVLNDLFGGIIGNVVDGVIGFIGTVLEVVLAIFGLLGDPESDNDDENEDGEDSGIVPGDTLGFILVSDKKTTHLPIVLLVEVMRRSTREFTIWVGQFSFLGKTTRNLK